MLSSLVKWAVNNRLVVILLMLALIGVGGHAFVSINVEAYPDPAPAIIEVIAQFPGASAEEVERQVTIPLEIALAGMPGLKSTRSKSLFGLAHLRNQFTYETSYKDARIEVLNRLTLATLPAGVQPEIAPTSPIGEIYRYVLRNPVDPQGHPVYSLTDLKALQDWTLEREFRRVPRIADVVSFGGEVKRYEIQPDPDRLRRFDITLEQLGQAIANSNLNAGGDFLLQPHSVQVVRGLGLLGGGIDPVSRVLALNDDQAVDAKKILHEEEERRLHEIRQIVLAATNNVPIRVGDVVYNGPPDPQAPQPQENQGVIVGAQTRLGRISVSTPVKDTAVPAKDHQHASSAARTWEDRTDVVEGVVLLRKGEQSLPALADVEKKVEELNREPGKLLPGVKIEVFDDRSTLVHRTTETVHENLIVGMVLVTLVLLIFLGNVRSALIVAINIPLALLFAFALLYLRGRSANLLSLGAVDFGIIVDSSVIMVECIYRFLSTGQAKELDMQHRILKATSEVQQSLFYSTLIMVCALLPLFLMTGPEGQIFGPMADAYAFALAGALLLALTLSPVLCRMLLSGVTHANDNFMVRGLKWFYLKQLELVLAYRWAVLGLFGLLLIGTALSLPYLGREFMPALEEGNVYIRGTFPASVSLNEVAEQSEIAKTQLKKYPEARAVLAQLGRPNDGTDPTGFYNAELFVPLINEEHWPKLIEQKGFWGWIYPRRARTKTELVEAMQHDLDSAVLGVDWNFSQAIRDNVMETLSGVKGENSVKIFGPDLATLEQKAKEIAAVLQSVRGIKSVGVFSIMGQTNLEFSIDRDKCALWNVSVADVQSALATAVGGKAFTQLVEGEKTFDITLRWPAHLRADQDQILDIPVDILKNRVIPVTSRDAGPVPISGTSSAPPSATGSNDAPLPNAVSRRRIRDLVTPRNDAGERDPNSPFTRSGASTIAREQGRRFIAIKFSVRDRDLASAVEEAQHQTEHLVEGPYAMEWSGEFEEMQAAVQRLSIVVCIALILILVLLYLALQSVLDVLTVFSNVIVICMGGIWSLFLTGTNFNISAGVGFISILGVGIMNGLIFVSAMNAARHRGMDVTEAIRDAVNRYVRPLTMTALAAILGMIPAAIATKVGSQSQKPLAIVVVGGMAVTLIFLNLIPVIYSFYGGREDTPDVHLEH